MVGRFFFAPEDPNTSSHSSTLVRIAAQGRWSPAVVRAADVKPRRPASAVAHANPGRVGRGLHSWACGTAATI